WLQAHGIGEASPGTLLHAPTPNGQIALAVAISADEPSIWTLGDGPTQLPPQAYELQPGRWSEAQRARLQLGWELGSYRFSRYKKPGAPLAALAGARPSA